jgi:hypothetical protein
VYPRNTVCFRYKTVNTLHKGDDKDDDDDNDDDNYNNNNNNNNCFYDEGILVLASLNTTLQKSS